MCASGGGVCVSMARCLSSATADELGVEIGRANSDLSFAPISCPLLDGCELRWLEATSGSCVAAADPVAVPARSRCLSLHDGGATAEGLCHGTACVPLGTCGNGVVEPGEECDDDTFCCDAATRLLAEGATCSGECCSRACTPEPTSVACGDGAQGAAGKAHRQARGCIE